MSSDASLAHVLDPGLVNENDSMNHVVNEDKLDTEELMDTREGICQPDRISVGLPFQTSLTFVVNDATDRLTSFSQTQTRPS